MEEQRESDPRTDPEEPAMTDTLLNAAARDNAATFAPLAPKTCTYGPCNHRTGYAADECGRKATRLVNALRSYALGEQVHGSTMRRLVSEGWVGTTLAGAPADVTSTGAAVLARYARKAVEAREAEAAAAAAELADLMAGTEDEPAAPATVTLTHEALVDLLTTAASIGRTAAPGTVGTRGDLTHLLGTYGLAVGNPRLVEHVALAEQTATALRAG